MAVLDVAEVEEEGQPLLIVFLPPETNFFNDVQLARLRDLLIKSLVSHGMSGELIALWEFEGHLNFLGNPHWHPFLTRAGVTGLHGKSTRQIAID